MLFLAPSPIIAGLFYFSLTLITVFTTALIFIIFYILLIVNLFLERSSYLIIEQKIISNKKIAIPLGLFLISTSSFLAQPIITFLTKILSGLG